MKTCYDSPKSVCKSCIEKLDFCIDFKTKLVKKQNQFYEFIESETIEERLEDEKITSSEDPLEDFLEVKVEECEIIVEDVEDNDQKSVTKSNDQLHVSKRFNCNQCNYTCAKTQRLTNHCKKIHNSSPPKANKQIIAKKKKKQCFECGIFVKNLSEHQKIIHHQLKRFCCDFCNYSCYFKTKITRHLQKHIPKHLRQQYPCTACEFKCTRRDSLKSHFLTMHQESRQKNCLCKECGKTFYNRSQLNIHTKAVHEKIRNHLCNLCGKSFFNSKDLEMHEKRHGQKNLACEICGNLFFCTLDLKRHFKIHSEPTIACEIEGCSKKFYTNSKLKIHVKIRHEGAKDFFCDYCR